MKYIWKWICVMLVHTKEAMDTACMRAHHGVTDMSWCSVLSRLSAASVIPSSSELKNCCSRSPQPAQH